MVHGRGGYDVDLGDRTILSLPTLVKEKLQMQDLGVEMDTE